MKAIKYFPLLSLLVLCLSFTSCDENPHPNRYDGCCGTESVNYTLNNIPLYIPNAFTPNYDGINDFFRPYYNLNIDEVTIEEFVITSPADEILFEVYDFRLTSNSFGWDGMVYPSRNEYVGLFHYRLVIFESAIGTRTTINSKACALRCDANFTVDIDNSENCTFGLQHDGAGGFDYRINPGEGNCF